MYYIRLNGAYARPYYWMETIGAGRWTDDARNAVLFSSGDEANACGAAQIPGADEWIICRKY